MDKNKSRPPTVDQLLATQDQVISRPQVLRAGHTSAWWDWKLAHHWQGVGKGVAIAHRGTPNEQELRWAAVLHAGPTAALTADASLAFFGVKRLTVTTYDVAVDATTRVATVKTSLLHMEPHRLTGLKRWRGKHPELPLVHIHAAVLHAAAWAVSDEEAERRLTMTVQQRKSSPLLIRASLEQMPRLPRRALIIEVLGDIELGAQANSELDFLRFCRRNQLPEPDQLQLGVRAGGLRYLDARYARQRVTVEVDGGHHRWAEQWESDALRSLQLAAAARGTGEQIIRITRGMMRHHEVETAALLRHLLV